MKILLDENIDVRLKLIFPSDLHTVFTIRDMKWNGIKNGALLKLLREHQFDCWVVVDKNIPYEQNLQKLPCTIIVLNVMRNTLSHLTPLMPKVLSVLEKENGNTVVVIDEN